MFLCFLRIIESIMWESVMPVKARANKMELETKVGKTEVVSQDAHSKGPGFYCDICDVMLKDSTSYVDHVNGRKRIFINSIFKLHCD